MSDLTLKEALEQYEAECREVLGEYDGGRALLEILSPSLLPYLNDVPIPSESYCELIGACVVWLKDMCRDKPMIHYARQPLRFYLNEVREHML